MSVKLNKAQIAERARIVAILEKARSALSVAFVNYSHALEEAREFRDDLVTDWRDEISDKSEKWRESERGEATAALVDAWEGLEFEGEFVPEIDLGHAEALAEAPEEPE
jgi:hypothetical protein